MSNCETFPSAEDILEIEDDSLSLPADQSRRRLLRLLAWAVGAAYGILAVVWYGQ